MSTAVAQRPIAKKKRFRPRVPRFTTRLHPIARAILLASLALGTATLVLATALLVLILHSLYFDRKRAALPVFREIVLKAYADKLVGNVPDFPVEMEDNISQFLKPPDVISPELTVQPQF
jgi:hypothetical protein